MDKEILVIDGACGTELQRLGYDVDVVEVSVGPVHVFFYWVHDSMLNANMPVLVDLSIADPLWSASLLLTNPQVIKDLHTSYLNAGADIILTATYQASIPGLVQYANLTEASASAVIAMAVRLAIEARDEFWAEQKACNKNGTLFNQHQYIRRPKPLVVGSVGPFGACQHDGSEFHGRYTDEMTIEELKQWHKPRIMELIQNGVDLIAFETIPAEKEAIALIQVLETFRGVKAWLSFVCKDDLHLNHGELFADVMERFRNHNQIVAIGTNCTNPQNVDNLIQSCKRLDAYDKPFIAYPNSGESWSVDRWDPTIPPVELSDYVQRWIKKGIRWIGGCCRTTPSDILKIRNKVDGIPKLKESKSLI
ncbi:Homocysteine S-methyltransferase YbgG [Trichoplax sp. H2]|nr:Homocysteine S-methyltransferase YbgG [Trichoplax sp. H2]|eukprot:RDD47583.1 Homocysteine S-methyltransferase YbgG [Trichoplax sp. H2]